MADVPSLPPQPPTDGPFIEDKPPTHTWALYLFQLDALMRNFISSFNSLNNGALLTTAGNQLLIGGFTETEFDLGTGAGTIAPNPMSSLKQKVTNNGAFSISPFGTVGDVELRIINGASAGAVSIGGFTKQWTGDPLDTVNGHQFMMFIYGFGGGASACIVKALQ